MSCRICGEDDCQRVHLWERWGLLHWALISWMLRFRIVRALRAFMRPGLARGWPGALRMGDGSALVLANPLDEMLFEPGMSLQLTDVSGGYVVSASANEGFDRRKGRIEAFADAWGST